ncbi:hypothetical protein SOVF_043750 [Spinacia oleracea]|uniref:Large ribosomal subunit protein bL9c n=1 Tax=Spinacia oleracea TaxID=3562 RepID=A0A9R0J7I4_SPIOL|nr:uncharacterized protein LOC110801765 [Spinacia oleracea]XP_021862872.2 uncharacterized protein LOC110801765 [Spinacia oleracea]KNA21371.1 hypothetical protein SOVF_043750 [Spinacia oleracea]
MAYYQRGRNILRRVVQDANSKRLDSYLHPLFFTGQGIRFRKLEVILTTNVDKLGKAGETVKVAPGYFRNYLMPKLLAVPNIDKFAYLVKEQRKIYQPIEEEEVKVVKESKEDLMKEYIAAAKRLDNGTVVLRRYFKVDNELREPVTKDEIIAEVARQLSVQVEPENLHMPNPLSSLGEHEIPLRLPKTIPMPQGKVMWTLKVKVRRK